MVRCFVAAACFAPLVTFGQTMNIDNDVQSVATLDNTTATLTGKAELHVTGAGSPLSGSTVIHLNSADAWFFMDSIRPGTVISTHLSRVRVSGANAVNGTNVRVAQYGNGAVVIPHAPAFGALQVYNGQNLTGSSTSLTPYTAYDDAALGSFANAIRSFRLKRGYTATIATEANGTGHSRNYVAADGDLEITLLPTALDNAVSFVRIFPWVWTVKKGVAGNIANDVNAWWFYNWNIDQNSTADLEYVPIRQQRWWPGLGQNWQTRGSNQLLGYNEPNSADQSNIAVGDAVWSWPDLLGTGLRVGSPAPTDGGLSSWLYPFMTQTAAENKRVDFVAVHYYRGFSNPADPNGAANQFYNFLLGIYNTTKKPIWITEWNNGANWVAEPDPTFAQQQATIAAMLTMLENAHFVERYAIYSWVEEVRQLHYNAGGLTPAGVTYRDRVSKIGYLQEMPDPGTTADALYAFDSNARDSSGNGHDTMVVGNPSSVTGQVGNALSFDGTSDHLVASSKLGDSTDFTFAGWVYPNSTAGWQRVFDFGDGTLRYLFLSPRSSGGQLRFAINTGGGEQQLSATALPTGTWSHVAVTISGNTGKLFVNGALVATNTSMSANPVDVGTRLNYIGKSQFAADPLFNGRLDDLRFHSTALTDAQIAAIAGVLPSPWLAADIGAVGTTGSSSYNSGTFTVVGSGADIAGTADEFRYVYQAGTGDGSIVARVASVQNTAPDAKAGVMYRESSAANSRFAAVYVTPGVGVVFQRRISTGGGTASTVVSGITAPRWVRIVRTGNNFAAYYSSNGTSWTQIGSTTAITMTTAVQLGLCVTSHLDGTLCTSTMDSVTATP